MKEDVSTFKTFDLRNNSMVQSAFCDHGYAFPLPLQPSWPKRRFWSWGAVIWPLQLTWVQSGGHRGISYLTAQLAKALIVLHIDLAALSSFPCSGRWPPSRVTMRKALTCFDLLPSCYVNCLSIPAPLGAAAVQCVSLLFLSHFPQRLYTTKFKSCNFQWI